MPVARIVTRNVAQESPALQGLLERLRAAGYDVELAQPGAGSAGADLLLELDQLPADEALDGAVHLARETGAELFVAPGLFPDRDGALPHELRTDPEARHSEQSEESVAEIRTSPEAYRDAERSFFGETLGDLNAAVSDSRAGIADSVSSFRARIGEAWQQFQASRADAAMARRLEREREQIEREERRRQHQVELQRQAEQKQRMIAERERLAAERERVLREEIAREAALRAERERAERESMAREAARRAEQAHAAEQERRRLAALEAEHLRARREPEAQRPVTPPPAPPLPVFEPALDAAPVLNPRLVRPARRIPSARERQWQRAAFIASIAALAAMLGYALAGNTHFGSAIPASLIQNGAQQQVPFGPAKMDVSSVNKKPAAPQAVSPRAVTSNSSGTGLARQGGGSTAQKPSAARPTSRRQGSTTRSANDFVAEDEVIVHHAPTSRAQRAQSTPGVRRYSDDN